MRPEDGLPERLAPFAELALACVHREYPNKIGHVLQGDGDVRAPRHLTPAFYGCFDWHSAVHGHWTLARYARRAALAASSKGGAVTAERARRALAKSLTAENVCGEVTYFGAPARAGTERPYGLAWLLQLALELREWASERGADEGVAGWVASLAPLEALSAQRMVDWLRKLPHPIRSGEHSQSAFAMGLCLDWARGVAGRRAGELAACGDARSELAETIEERARAFHLGDRGAPLAFEPSGHDFLSPCLAEADLLRRVLRPGELAAWLDGFFPALTTKADDDAWLTPTACPDRADGKLAHLDGLNLSRAWMLRGVASGLPPGDARIAALLRAAGAHADAGLAAIAGAPYEGTHWLGTFATYLLTDRGLDASAADALGSLERTLSRPATDASVPP